MRRKWYKITHRRPLARVTTSHNESQRVINLRKPLEKLHPAGGRGSPGPTCAASSHTPGWSQRVITVIKQTRSWALREEEGFLWPPVLRLYTLPVSHNESPRAKSHNGYKTDPKLGLARGRTFPGPTVLRLYLFPVVHNES